MPQRSTLFYVANLVVRRVLAEAGPETDLAEALRRAYPFDNSPEARRIWREVVLRYGVEIRDTPAENDDADGEMAAGC